MSSRTTEKKKKAQGAKKKKQARLSEGDGGQAEAANKFVSRIS